MEKLAGAWPGDGGKGDEMDGGRGWKVSRKVESALRCLTVRDMMICRVGSN